MRMGVPIRHPYRLSSPLFSFTNSVLEITSFFYLDLQYPTGNFDVVTMR